MEDINQSVKQIHRDNMNGLISSIWCATSYPCQPVLGELHVHFGCLYDAELMLITAELAAEQDEKRWMEAGALKPSDIVKASEAFKKDILQKSCK